MMKFISKLLGWNSNDFPTLTKEFKDELRRVQSMSFDNSNSLYIVLDKRKELLNFGCPKNALMIARCKYGKNFMHYSLIVKTKQGNYVLDPSQSDIVKFTKMNRREDWKVLSIV